MMYIDVHYIEVHCLQDFGNIASHNYMLYNLCKKTHKQYTMKCGHLDYALTIRLIFTNVTRAEID